MTLKHQIACHEFTALEQEWQKVSPWQLYWLWPSPSIDDIIQAVKYNMEINARVCVVWDLNHGGTETEL